MSERAVYFISDAHLGTDPPALERARERRLHDFLNSLPGRAQSLYIVGDLFDFWFEYRTAIPRRYFETLCVLRRLREQGVEILYMNGNHDFWLGPFLSDELGVRTHDGPLVLETQGRRAWIHHGDGLMGGDSGYKILKRAIRHRWSIAFYSWLHPDLGIPFAHWVSNLSRESRDPSKLQTDKLRREIAAPRFAEGYDAVLIGHFHTTFEHREDGKDFFILGDWMDRFTYVVLEEGHFRLETWPERTD